MRPSHLFIGILLMFTSGFFLGCGGGSVPSESADQAANKAVYPPLLEGANLVKGRAIWIQSCKLCHKDGGEDDAPILGDITAWASLAAKGLPTLYKSAVEGKGHMPAMLGRKGITHEDIQSAVDFMVEASK